MYKRKSVYSQGFVFIDPGKKTHLTTTIHLVSTEDPLGILCDSKVERALAEVSLGIVLADHPPSTLPDAY